MCRLSRCPHSWGSGRVRLYYLREHNTGDTDERMGKLGDLVRFPLDQQ